MPPLAYGANRPPTVAKPSSTFAIELGMAVVAAVIFPDQPVSELHSTTPAAAETPGSCPRGSACRSRRRAAPILAVRSPRMIGLAAGPTENVTVPLGTSSGESCRASWPR